MTRELPQPPVERISLSALLDALSDPVRRKIAAQLAEQGELNCSGFLVHGSKTNVSYHLARMREAGLTTTRVEGTSHHIRLRVEDLETRFPGLLDAVLSSIVVEERTVLRARKPLVGAKKTASRVPAGKKRGT